MFALLSGLGMVVFLGLGMGLGMGFWWGRKENRRLAKDDALRIWSGTFKYDIPSIDRAIRIASDFGCRRTQLTIALQTANVSEILSWVFLICFWYNARNLGLKELSMCRFGVRWWNFKLIISLTPHTRRSCRRVSGYLSIRVSDGPTESILGNLGMAALLT